MRFYFDFISPYAYLAWQRVHELAARHGRDVEPIPILFAALLDHHGHKGPAEIPSKRSYVGKHVMRLAHDLEVPLEPPLSHPFNPLLGLRMSAMDMPEMARRTLIDALYLEVWGGGGGITDPGHLVEVLNRVGLDGARLVTGASDPEIKDRVRRNTARALGEGVFGVPTIVVDDELFWGLDAMPHVDKFLAGEDPLTPAQIERWLELPASARRPGSK